MTAPHEYDPLHIRWMIRRDMPEVVAIECEAFEFPWADDDFVRCLRQRNCIGMVAEVADTVVGYMIYELQAKRVHVLNMAVQDGCRRAGVGRRMIEKLQRKLTPQRRNRILAEVRESNLPAQLFLRQLGFRAVTVLRDYYDDTPEDAYLFQYRLPSADVGLPAARFAGLPADVDEPPPYDHGGIPW